MARFRSRFRNAYRRVRSYRPRFRGRRVLGMKISPLMLLGAAGLGAYFFRDKIKEMLGK